jgi:hypothetical protein
MQWFQNIKSRTFGRESAHREVSLYSVLLSWQHYATIRKVAGSIPDEVEFLQFI